MFTVFSCIISSAELSSSVPSNARILPLSTKMASFPSPELTETEIMFWFISQPEYPTAATILPQLGSPPKIADFTSEELITDFEAKIASFSPLAPLTLHSMNLVAPSPSRAIILAKLMQMKSKAFWKSSLISPSLATSTPDFPFAIKIAVSFVLWSPSTTIMLKLLFTADFNALLIISADITASVAKKQSMVPILGAIIPTPLVIPPILSFLPSISVSTANSLW